jgi:hypothetical protein
LVHLCYLNFFVLAGSSYATLVPSACSDKLALSFQQVTKEWRASNYPWTMISCRSKYKAFVHFSCENEALSADSEGERVVGENIFYVRLDPDRTCRPAVWALACQGVWNSVPVPAL